MAIWLTKQIQEKKGPEWETVETISEEVTQEFYDNAISFYNYNKVENFPFLKMFMGKELAYTDKQGRIIKFVSINPDETIRSIWDFKFYRK